MKKGKKLYLGLLILITIMILTVSFSYAFFISKKEEHGKLNMVAGTLNYQIKGEEIEENKITVPKNSIKEVKLTVTSLNEIDSKYELYYIGNEQVEVGYMEPEENTKGEIRSNKEKEVTIYIKNDTSTTQIVTLGVEGGFLRNELVLRKGHSISKVVYQKYQEGILNGADPVLTDNLVPITIDNDGTVRKADMYSKWYSYEEKNWANAVVPTSNKNYKTGEIIPEEEIESYFVWIPRYKYKIFNEGNYTELTSFTTDTPKAIEIVFEDKNTTASNGTKEGSYLTHPAFTSFDVNGIWVGKFETGYDQTGNESITKEGAQVNSSDSRKILIKPNIYSWRGITIGNMFEASYNYLRDLDSHMMKNTEWGAMAYLTNSNYGRCDNGVCSEVRINNNYTYITGYAATEQPTLGFNLGVSIEGNRIEGTNPKIDGTYTVNYLNNSANIASTTGNRSGIYDTSGGSFEYVMGYTTGASTEGGFSEITSIHPDFFTNDKWNKYYDKYTSTAYTDYNNRILGDATGELGPFGSEIDLDNNTQYKSSWYKDTAFFVLTYFPWFARGGIFEHGSNSGIFLFRCLTGGVDNSYSFRLVLAP